MMAKFYLLLTPLPPDTTIRAVVKSGLPESEFYSLTKIVLLDDGSSTSLTYGFPVEIATS